MKVILMQFCMSEVGIFVTKKELAKQSFCFNACLLRRAYFPSLPIMLSSCLFVITIHCLPNFQAYKMRFEAYHSNLPRTQP